MGKADPIVVAVRALEMPLVQFDTDEGIRYTCDLKKFEGVYCFPKSQEEWEEVFEMEGDRIVWKNRFDVHVDQAIAYTIRKESSEQSSAS